ncbi:ABC transporter permease [bacterium]|nr:ABC transporter permease [bacterium]
MFSNYIRTSLRKLNRTKLHTTVNIAGLTLGLLCAIVIFQKVRFEYSFDTYHEDPDRLYRVVRNDIQDGEPDLGAGLPFPFVDAFRADFREVERLTLVDTNFETDPLIGIHDPDGTVRRFKEERNVAFVEPDYFEMFHYEWLSGDLATALAQPQSAVISRSLAEKYFGTIDVLGRSFTFSNRYEVTITGVVEDPPANTELPFSMLLARYKGSDTNLYKENDNWGSVSSSVQAFLKIKSRDDAAEIDSEFPAFIAKYRDPDDAKDLGYRLQPLKEVHFDDRYGTLRDSDPITKGSLSTLSWVGIFLLLTACINFVNLNVVLVFRRAKEVAVRKVLGGTSGNIASYFMTETALSVVFALVLAFLLANPVLKFTSSIVGTGVTVSPFSDSILVAASLIVAIIVTLIAGLYPSAILSSIQPVRALRGTSSGQPKSFLSVRRGLVVFQFMISQVFIIGTLVAMNQMSYINSAPLGYEPDAIVEFPIPTRIEGEVDRLKEQIALNPTITGVTYSNSGATSGNTWASSGVASVEGEWVELQTQVKLIDYDYMNVYGMKLIAGRGFERSDSASGIVVNETFARRLGFDDPTDILGTLVKISSWNNIPITGVIEDFHTNSMRDEVESVTLIQTAGYAYLGAAKIPTGQINASIDAIRESWEATYPNFIFEYDFLDDKIAELYEEEQTTQSLIQLFASIAILIGCIGLYGLISYSTSQRAREVGIRKVLGASTTRIVGLFSKEYVFMVLFGFAVSAPVAYIVMNEWLDNFAYRIDIGVGTFGAAFVLSFVIALLTVSVKTIRSAQANPVDTIRRA